MERFLVRVYPVRSGKTNKEVNSMKKRIFMLAVAAALVLSCVGMAAADTHIFFKLTGISNVSKDTDSQDVTTISFDVTAKYEVATSRDVSALANATDFTDGWFKNANLVKMKLGGSSNTFTPTSFTINGSSTTATGSSGTTITDPFYLMYPASSTETTTFNAGSNGDFTIKVVAKGTLQYPDEDCQIRVSLYNAEDDSSILTSYTSGETKVVEVDGAEVLDNIDPIDYDPRNPYGYAWDGIDPVLSNDINVKSYDYGKAKPKLGKIQKAELTFTPGDSSDTLVVPIVGPVTKVDVYIAVKDAKKLYPASADKITKDIQLTRENIGLYSIPFRITSYDFAKTATGSTAKDIQKAWKKAESSVTLSFNGAYLEYKSFPITFALSNTNNSSNPTKKAVKLNIGSEFSTPAWTYNVASREITTSLDVAEKMVAKKSWDQYVTKYIPVRVEDKALSIDNYYVTAASWDMEIPAKASFDVVFQSTDKVYYVIPSFARAISDDGISFTTSEDNRTNKRVYTTKWGKTPSYYYHPFDILTVLEKKDKPEAAAAVGGDTVESIDETFTVSADFAPYAITVKPALTDTAKFTKFFENGYKVTLVQPVYDYLGSVKSNGYVRIQGVPKEKEKESKLGITLTATNPSTKKKAAAKVTAMGKIVPYFEEKNTTKINGEQWISTKRVQAGKVPSAKFKAKGSKTISYYLGNYYLDDGQLVENEKVDDEYTHDVLAKKLAALGLSFDAKKGVYAPDKTKLNTPTLNEKGDAFKSLDIVVTAANNVGTSQVWAALPITGAKPALVDKEAEFTSPALYAYTTFALKAGQDEVNASTTTANVKATESGTTSTLAQYGLTMVTYDEFIVGVKSTDTFAKGASITDKYGKAWTPKSADYAVVSGEAKPVKNTSGDITGYVASTDNVMIYNGKVDGVVSPDARLKNQGIIQITNLSLFTTKGTSKTANGVKVNVALENLGAAGKGSLKVKVPDASASSSGALPGSFKALAENGSSSSAAKAKTNGTAGYAHNNGALPDDAETEESEEEAAVTVGEPRTAADLTAGQQAYLAAKGLKVIAVLPEISANVEGQQKFDVVLDEDAPEDAKMVYVPFPQNAEETEDDSIADFYGADGEPIEEVPAEKAITAAPWLRADVVYQPVIAAEAE